MRVPILKPAAAIFMAAALLSAAGGTSVADDLSPTPMADDAAVAVEAPDSGSGAPVYRAALTSSASVADSITLYQQTANAYWYLAAATPYTMLDDFTLPGDTSSVVRYVSARVLVRDLFQDVPPTELPDISVAFYTDGGGWPGTLIASQTVAAETLLHGTPLGVAPDATYTDVVVPLPSPVELTPGTKWIRIGTTGLAGKAVYFQTTTTQIGTRGMYTNYGDNNLHWMPVRQPDIAGLVFGLYTRVPTLGAPRAPVDTYPTLNTVKAGATVPVKWTLTWADDQSFASDTSLLRSATYTTLACEGTAAYDTVEWTAAGGTSLRWDSTDNAFVFNFKTPKTTGCGRLDLTMAGDQHLFALFNLK